MLKKLKTRLKKLGLKKIWKKHWKRISAVAVVALIGALVARRTVLKPEPEFETATVIRQDLSQTLEVSGEIKADKMAVLKFQTGGKLSWVGVQAGDRVNRWQAVASLDKNILKRRLEKALNDYLHQRWDFDQIREDNLVTTDNYDEYSFTNAIERAIEQEQFLLNKTVLDAEIQDLTNKLATLVSPLAGIVIDIDSPVAGVNITPSDAITIVDPQSLYFEIEIDESDIGSVAIGQKAQIFLEAFADEAIESQIIWIDFAASTSDGGSTVFKAKLSLPVESDNFRLGMTGDAAVVLAEKLNVLTLPLEAVAEDEDSYVLRFVGSKLERVSVETGIETDDSFEVISGVSEADQVVLPGSVDNIDDLRNLRRGSRILRGR